MKTSELKKMSIEELKKELESILNEQFKLRMQVKTGQLTRHHLLKVARKNIAKIKTILKEKESTGA